MVEEELTEPRRLLPPCFQFIEAICSGLPVNELRWETRLGYLMIVLDDTVSRAQLEGLKPNFTELRNSVGDAGIRGVIVTCKGDIHSGAEVLSRFFAPWLGVDEDPVTGSAHSLLCPYWCKRLHRDHLQALQVVLPTFVKRSLS
mmetsp:Transcript_11374/g.26989  ORF Transcript_11374/g.26989 Transcript_11374/m.26989 type:complete len:144 (+) Transcript_11374:854-1285(+)